jgi:hypothetical protein
MLGSKEKLTWEKIGEGIIVNIPESLQEAPPCKEAWVVRIAE